MPVQMNYRATDREPNEERTNTAEEQIKAWRESGDLPFPDMSAEQQDELRPILEEQAAARRAIKQRKHEGEAWTDLRPEMRAQREATTERIESVLDEEQLDDFRALREHHEKRIRERHGKHEAATH